MTSPVCRWPLLDVPLGECRKGTLPGSDYCREHDGLVPVWPKSDYTGLVAVISADAPEGLKEMFYGLRGTGLVRFEGEKKS